MFLYNIILGALYGDLASKGVALIPKAKLAMKPISVDISQSVRPSNTFKTFVGAILALDSESFKKIDTLPDYTYSTRLLDTLSDLLYDNNIPQEMRIESNKADRCIINAVDSFNINSSNFNKIEEGLPLLLTIPYLYDIESTTDFSTIYSSKTNIEDILTDLDMRSVRSLCEDYTYNDFTLESVRLMLGFIVSLRINNSKEEAYSRFLEYAYKKLEKSTFSHHFEDLLDTHIDDLNTEEYTIEIVCNAIYCVMKTDSIEEALTMSINIGGIHSTIRGMLVGILSTVIHCSKFLPSSFFAHLIEDVELQGVVTYINQVIIRIERSYEKMVS